MAKRSLKSLKKARVDEGKTTKQKVVAREDRNWRSEEKPKGFGDLEGATVRSKVVGEPKRRQSSVHEAPGTFTKKPHDSAREIARYRHQKVMRGLRSLKPTLKSELSKTPPSESQPSLSAASPSISLRNWTYKPDPSRGLIHFEHQGNQGTITVKRNDRASAKDFPYIAVHNGAPIGRYKSPTDAAMGVANYVRILPQNVTRMHNVPSSKMDGKFAPVVTKDEYRDMSTPPPEPNKANAAAMQSGATQSGWQPQQWAANLASAFSKSEDYFRSLLSNAKPKQTGFCPKDLDPAINRQFESSIMRGLSDHPMKKDESAAAAAQPASQQHGASDPVAPSQNISRSYALLTDEAANTKTAKSGKRGEHLSSILHLAPADLAGGKNMCPFATEGCRHACLNTSGRGGMLDKEYDLNDIQLARIRKTKEFQKDPHEFLGRINKDIHKLKGYAERMGRKPVVRLNGTSDVNWAAMRSPSLEGKNLFEAHPDVQFYDYTKNPYIIKNNKHPNYHVTFSYADGDVNHKHAQELLNEGHNVAVVFGGKKDGKATMPKTFMGKPVVNGDEHDLRFLDPKGGYVIGLSAKGDAMYDTTGFVQWGHEGEPDAKPRPKPEKDRYARVKGASAEDAAKLKEKQAANKAARKLLRNKA